MDTMWICQTEPVCNCVRTDGDASPDDCRCRRDETRTNRAACSDCRATLVSIDVDTGVVQRAKGAA